jgi:predicted dehydrogenase
VAPLAGARAAANRTATEPSRPALRAALVGVGAVAREHLHCLAALDGAEVVAVCDLSPAVAESAASRFGVPRHYTDHAAMLDELAPDFVHVTTPPGAHFQIALDALAAGAHAIVEKPIVADAAQLEPLLVEAERRGRVVVEDYNYVFNPQVRAIRRLMATGELGAIQHVEVDLSLDILSEGSPFADRNRPHPALDMPGGAIADFLPHLASLVYFLAGPHRAVETVWSKRRAGSPLEVDDLRALVDAEHASASISFSASTQPDGFWLRVHGGRMRVEANLFEPRMTVERLWPAPAPLFPILNGVGEIAALGRAAATGLLGKLRGAPGAYGGLWELIGRVYGAVARGEPPPVSPADIRAVNGLVGDLVAGQQRP